VEFYGDSGSGVVEYEVGVDKICHNKVVVLEDTSKRRLIRFGSLHWTEGGAEESTHKVDMDPRGRCRFGNWEFGTGSRREGARGVEPVNFQPLSAVRISNELGAMMLIGEP
jgi:hypothetical protein